MGVMSTLSREEWHAKQIVGSKPLYPTFNIPDGIFYPLWAKEAIAKTVQLLKCGVTSKNETHIDKRYKRKADYEPYPMKRMSFSIAYAIDMVPYESRPAYLVEARPLVLVDSESDQTFALDCQLYRRANLIGEPCDPAKPYKPTIVVSWTGPDDGVYPERDANGVALEISMDSCWDCLVDGRKCGKVGLILDGPRAGEYLPLAQRRYRTINEIFGLPEQYSLFVKGSRQHTPVKRKSRSSIEPMPEKKSKPNPTPLSHPSLPLKPTPSSSTSAGPPQGSIQRVLSPSPPPTPPSAPQEVRLVGRREFINSFASRRSSQDASDDEVPESGTIETEAVETPASAAEALHNLIEDPPASTPAPTSAAPASAAAAVIAPAAGPEAPVHRSSGTLANATTISRPPTPPVSAPSGMVPSINKVISKPAEIYIRGAAGPRGSTSPTAGSETRSPATSVAQSSQSSSTTAVGSPSEFAFLRRQPTNWRSADTLALPLAAPMPPSKTPSITSSTSSDPARQHSAQPGQASTYVPTATEKLQWHFRHMSKLCADTAAEHEATSLRAQALEVENTRLTGQLARVKSTSDAQALALLGSGEREKEAKKATEAEKVAKEQAEAANMELKKEAEKAKGEREEAVMKGHQAVKEAIAKLDQALRERDQAAKQRDQTAGERDQAAEERDTAAKLAKIRLMESLEAAESLKEETTRRTQAEEALRERRRVLIELRAELEELRNKQA